MAKQYELYGYVSNSLIAVFLLQSTYILDFFYHEGWYLRTIDIAHDHFGFYLAWGDTVFLPMTYTLQSLYLLYNPVQLSVHPRWWLCCAWGWSGYWVFRAVNNQKDRVRQAKGKCNIWGPRNTLRAHSMGAITSAFIHSLHHLSLCCVRCDCSGKPAEYIEVHYSTKDGPALQLCYCAAASGACRATSTMWATS